MFTITMCHSLDFVLLSISQSKIIFYQFVDKFDVFGRNGVRRSESSHESNAARDKT